MNCSWIYLEEIQFLIEKVKGQVMEAVLPSIGGGITDAIPEMTGDAVPTLPEIPGF